MNFIIKETGEIKSLFIIDPKTAVDYINDFIGNTGALLSDNFCFDEDRGAYACSQETFDWWAVVASDNQRLEDRMYELAKKHGDESVYEAIKEAGNGYLEDLAHNVNEALDAALKILTN